MSDKYNIELVPKGLHRAKRKYIVGSTHQSAFWGIATNGCECHIYLKPDE